MKFVNLFILLFNQNYIHITFDYPNQNPKVSQSADQKSRSPGEGLKQLQIYSVNLSLGVGGCTCEGVLKKGVN